jgi:hypothetical protein
MNVHRFLKIITGLKMMTAVLTLFLMMDKDISSQILTVMVSKTDGMTALMNLRTLTMY